MIDWLLDEKMPVWDADPPAFLSPAEVSDLAGKRFAKRRAEWLHGRWAAKNLLKKRHPACAGLPLAEIIIANAPGGAPYAALPDGTLLSGCLSITHSGSLAACALTFDPNLSAGIDLERIENRPAGFFEAYFTPSENVLLQKLPSEKMPQALTLFWSAKESVLKALRTGLSLDTRQIEISPGEEDPHPLGGWYRFEAGGSFLEDKNISTNCPFWAGWWRADQGYILTLAGCCQNEELYKGLRGEIPFQVG